MKQLWLRKVIRKTGELDLTEMVVIELGDVTTGMHSPCVLDLKMGFGAYNPQKMEKQQRKSRETTSGELGFRVSGLEVRSKCPDLHIFKNKAWGR